MAMYYTTHMCVILPVANTFHSYLVRPESVLEPVSASKCTGKAVTTGNRQTSLDGKAGSDSVAGTSKTESPECLQKENSPA